MQLLLTHVAPWPPQSASTVHVAGPDCRTYMSAPDLLTWLSFSVTLLPENVADKLVLVSYAPT